MAPGLALQARLAAEELAAACPRSTPSELARRLGLEIVEACSVPPAQPLLRSEYTSHPPRIILYAPTIRARFAQLDTTRGRYSSLTEFRQLHIAHELFHHLETQGRFGSLTREESERAAHAFAEHLCGLGTTAFQTDGAEPLSGEPWT